MVLPAPVYSSAPYVLNRLNNLARYSNRTRKLIKFAKTAGNFLIGNPFTPAGRLSWGLAAAKVGGVYFGHKIYKHMSKRRRSESGMATQMYGSGGVDAGATNVVQRSWHQSRSGKKPKKNAKLALRMLNAAQSSCIMRFQRLSGYEGTYDASIDIGLGIANRPLPLGHIRIGTTDDYFMPVQLFDLTSISSAPEGSVALDAPCNYCLSYNNSNGYYTWSPTVCKGPFPSDEPSNYSSTRHWWLEQSPNGVTYDARPQITKRAYTPWVDVRMVLYGATTETTRVTVQVVQFKEDMFDPTYKNIAGAYLQADQRFNQFWNNTLKPKVFNPIASAGVKTEQIFKILSHKTYVIGPDSSTNADTFQPNVVCKKFINLNRVCKYDWLKGYDPSGGTTVTGNTEVVYPAGQIPVKITNNSELDSDQFNQFMRNDTLPYLHPKAKVFLLVMADAYSQENASSRTGVPTNGATKVPCMDIIIRKKLIYDDT